MERERPPVKTGRSPDECRMGLIGATTQVHTCMKEKLKARHEYTSPCGRTLSLKDGVPAHGLRNEISSGKIGEKDLRCIVPLKEAEMTALSLKKSMQSVAPFDPFEESQKM
jgi:hypothetical protein